MNSRFLLLAAFVALTLTLAGCKPAQAPEAAPTSEAAAPAAEGSTTPAAAPVAVAGVSLSADPAGLRTCDKKSQAVTMKWDASAAGGVKRVELWTSTPTGEPKLFARAAPIGEKKTGPWVKIGSQFILKDMANGAELSRIKIAGLPCP